MTCFYNFLKNNYIFLMKQRWLLPCLLVMGFVFSFLIPHYGLLNQYVQLVIMFVGINIILTVSLNLINGYMGEFSVGHAGFMATGAYIASLLTVKAFPALWAHPFFSGFYEKFPFILKPLEFPLAVLAGATGAAILGLLISIPSFKTRGDYLAIVTLAFNMIVKSVIENIEAVGAARGFMGMDKLTTLPWVFFWTLLTVWLIRNFIYSNFGRGVISIREDEIASGLMGVRTTEVKLQAFVVSAFFTGIAGGLFAHLLQFIDPPTFDIIKSTEILIMVYLGGIGSIAGSIMGATIYTVLLEILRDLGIWRMVIMPLLLVLLMIFRPRGIMGLRELPWFIPKSDLNLYEKCNNKKDKD